MLQGKFIVLGVTGGIAAYKAAELVRLFVKAGANVSVLMTDHAQEFVTPLTFQALSGNPVHTDLFNLYQEKEIGHISLADRADLMVVAPATANLVGKLAAGLADDLLTTTLMATKAPVLLAPAMNVNMWENPIYQRNQQQLREGGYHILDPDTGLLACGWEGKGKLPAPEVIFAESERLLSPQDLRGETVLVTAGPTREELDPVRYISNYSSGKMGYAIAHAARMRGARVMLVSGPTCLCPPSGVEFHPVVDARQMHETVMRLAPEAGMIVKAAAVADYRPAGRSAQKLKKESQATWCLELERNPDILADLGRLAGSRILVGFAAETADLVENAEKKLHAKNLDLIVANDVTAEGAGFDGETNIVRLLFRDGRQEALPLMHKGQVAQRLLDEMLVLRSHQEKLSADGGGLHGRNRSKGGKKFQ